MKRKLLLLPLSLISLAAVQAQKRPASAVTYAITAPKMGHSQWTEVRQVDMKTGEVLKTTYLSTDKPKILNARTGKPVKVTEPEPMIVKGSAVYKHQEGNVVVYITSRENKNVAPETGKIKTVRVFKQPGNGPFATNSAACAYDKKHNRLYYTPMGINQLRYIDLKGDEPVIHYFEDEAFGVVKGSFDHANQVTRMAIASNGKGYALTNNGNHLVQFSTGKKARITDLGALVNHESNGSHDVLGGMSHGGDMVADDKENLYLVTANRAVYRISIETKVARYLGHIQGLPKNFTTNGAAVESDTRIVVTSSTNTSGYYIFDIRDLKAERFSTAEKVFNASDFANENLLRASKVKEEPKQDETPVQEPVVQLTDDKIEAPVETIIPSLKVYPNPVSGSTVNVTFSDHSPGRYRINLMDMNGKLVQSEPVTLNAKSQQVEIGLTQMARGTYLLQVTGENGKLVSSEKLLVQ